MQKNAVESKIEALAAEVAQREGCLLYDLKFSGGLTGRTLKVFIDKDPDGVGVDDCANVSRGLSLLLDVNDVIGGGAYDLEVSSPGLERHLSADWHFKRVVGKTVDLTLKNPVELISKKGTPISQRHFKGEILTTGEESFQIQVNDVVHELKYSNVDKAKVIFEPNLKTKNAPKKGAKKG